MKSTEAYRAFWYVCPGCEREISVKLDQSIETIEPICYACMHCCNLEMLNRLKLPHEICYEWKCECGKFNVVFPVIRRLGHNRKGFKHLPAQPGLLIEEPSFGLCEECGAHYRLEYFFSKRKKSKD